MSKSGAGFLILTVDDDADLLRLLTLRLQSVGYRVATAASGKEALASLALARPHAVITDLRMAGMDGMALFQRIHDQDPSLPVIVLTAHGSIPDAVQATQQGVFGYLTKPFDARELLELLARAVAWSGGAAEAATAPDEDWRADIITANPRMLALLSEARLVAGSEASVLIRGESGTGKELLAQAIHRASPRAASPFVAINCAAIPEPLLESELFGHVKGAFTGAVSSHKGLFQAAAGGTLFLDEIGDLPLALQVKLLRVLQDREVRPVGATQSLPVDVRIVSATHRDLEAATTLGEFREDLYYRLNVVGLALPPLRERREDIPLLVRQFLERCDRQRVNGFTPEAMEMLTAYDWPGNVRQLGNVVEQCCALCGAPLAPASQVIRALGTRPATTLTYAEAKDRFEQDYLTGLMKSTHGQVAAAARLAGRNRTEFYRLLQKHGLTPDRFKATE